MTSPFVENNRCFLNSICFRTISIVVFQNKIIAKKIYYTELLTCDAEDSQVVPLKIMDERHKHLMMRILEKYYYWHNLEQKVYENFDYFGASLDQRHG